jgi:hypothetical protein
MKNWRALLAAFFVAFSLQGDLLGLPSRLQHIIEFISIMWLGWNVKDKYVTGGLVFQGDSDKAAHDRARHTEQVIEKIKKRRKDRED